MKLVSLGRALRVARRLVPVALVGAALVPARPALAQQGSWISGTVRAEGGPPIAGAAVGVEGRSQGARTDASGAFRLGPLPAGDYTLRVSALGYREAERSTRLGGGEAATVAFVLAARPVQLAGIQVAVLQPTLQPQSRLKQEEVREANPRDVGEALRVVPGVDAVRRGALGLDPVVRGLRETEVGVYLDGTRQFPAGPARMDSPLTHLDPSALERVQVVKGPYALTWGAGNMSAVRVETHAVPPLLRGVLHGRFLSGYDANLGAKESAASISGAQDRVAYWIHGAWREGDDYRSGAGDLVQGDFLSREVRGKLGYELAPGSWLSVSGGYQWQDGMDYPGSLLNAKSFRARNVSARWSWDPEDGAIRSVEALAYANDVDHAMSNDGKPTALPMEGRTPPFPLDIGVAAEVAVQGGRLAAVLEPGPGWEAEVGGDLYRANRDALRTISRRDTGMQMFRDLMWPDATIRDAGAFARMTRELGGSASLAATVRLDGVWAGADTASDFFLRNVSTDLSDRETNWSASAVASTRPAEHWTLSLGLGSVVRTADASERYGDRVPASKAQTSAEFVGSPGLDPERSTQADLWLEGRYPRLSLSLDAFARRVDDYITLEPTDLPKRLPLSPPTVYRYVNGRADFRGAEATAALSLAEPLTLGLGASWLWGQDRTLDEPALGMSPLRGKVRLRWEPVRSGPYVEALLTAVDGQDRVAVTRGEIVTPGYSTLDVQGGVSLARGLMLRAGVNNVLDRAYVDHLNARNPFTGLPIAEPGRVAFARLSWDF